MKTLLDELHQLQDGLVARATGGDFQVMDYQELRSTVHARSELWERMPDFVKRCQNLDQFWAWIGKETSGLTTGIYAARRTIIWEGFEPIISFVENSSRNPASESVSFSIDKLNSDQVLDIWKKALERKTSDPAGAITAARTLLESTCKTILDECGVSYPSKATLPQLWRSIADELNLAPSQHHEQAFKTILGSCQSIVDTVGNLRNKIGDAHGQGRNPVVPKPRHAELVVNLAGSMASFLVSTWKETR